MENKLFKVENIGQDVELVKELANSHWKNDGVCKGDKERFKRDIEAICEKITRAEKPCRCKNVKGLSIIRGEVINKVLYKFQCKDDKFEVLKDSKVVFESKSYLTTDDNFTNMLFKARQHAQIMSSLNRLEKS